MELLKPEDGDILARYGHAYDGLVRAISIDLPTREPTSITVELLTHEAGGGTRWVGLRFVLRSVSEYRFSEGKVTYQVLGDGARLVWMNGKVTLDMDPGPDGIDNPIPGHQPGFFVTGTECSWEEIPYKE